jgi:hypothetical protein
MLVEGGFAAINPENPKPRFSVFDMMKRKRERLKLVSDDLNAKNKRIWTQKIQKTILVNSKLPGVASFFFV